MFSRHASGRKRYSAFIGNIVKGCRTGNEQRMDVNTLKYSFSYNYKVGIVFFI